MSRPGKKDGTSDLDLPGEMDDRAWECSMCDEYAAEVALWFAENSGAQAALGRVRELADGWERTADANPRNYAASLFGTAARDLRAALGDA